MSKPLNEEIKEWLVDSVALSDVKRHAAANDWDIDVESSDWLKFTAKCPAEGRLWSFRSPDHTWTRVPHCGMEGYAIMLGTELVDVFITALS